VREVQQRLSQPARIGRRPCVRSRRLARNRAHADLAAFRDRADPLSHARHDLVRRQRLDRQAHFARLDDAQVEQLVDQLGQVINLALDLQGELAGGGLVVVSRPR
jgi:hypothetical protein